MFREKQMYALHCDRCGQAYEDEGEPVQVAQEDREELEREAELFGWAIQDGKHYCPACIVRYDYESDRYVIKP